MLYIKGGGGSTYGTFNVPLQTEIRVREPGIFLIHIFIQHDGGVTVELFSY